MTEGPMPEPGDDDQCVWCGRAILPSDDYISTDDGQGQREWWHGTCRDRAVAREGSGTDGVPPPS